MTSLFSRLFNFLFKTHKHFFILLLFIPWMMVFSLLERITVPQYFLYTWFDDIIPFVEIMIVPYLFWYLYIIFAFVFLGFTDVDIFKKTCAFVFIGMAVCYVAYFLFPNGQNLRPVIIENDIFSCIIKYIYLMDTPTNSAPSIHVINTLAIHIGLINSKSVSTIKGLKGISFVTAILIILSTMMVKQHSLIDVIYGLLVSLILYVAIYNNTYKKEFTEPADIHIQ